MGSVHTPRFRLRRRLHPQHIRLMPNTQENLKVAFAGESQANRKYTAFAQKADKDGFPHVAKLFRAAAEAETIHALAHFQNMGCVNSTLDNLKAAAGGEHEEWTLLYPEFARIAREEGFEQIAVLWDKVCNAEKQHEKRYNDLWKNLSDGKVFKRDGVVVWRCLNCGYLHEAAEAPKLCPACLHPQAYFELLGENW